MFQITKSVEIKLNNYISKKLESFINLIPLAVKTAEGITEAMKNKLQKDRLNNDHTFQISMKQQDWYPFRNSKENIRFESKVCLFL